MAMIGDEDRQLIDMYLDQVLEPDGVRLLEYRLENDSDLRKFFVEYASLDTAVHLHSRAKRSLDRSLETAFEKPRNRTQNRMVSSGIMPWSGWAAAALVLLAFWLFWGQRMPVNSNVAWVINAQDCRWVDSGVSQGQIEVGKPIEIASGLVELGFACGAQAIVEGPASFVVLDDTQIQMNVGRVAVRMPKGLSGFRVLSPSGEVTDLGTEFGIVVSDNGETEVIVYEGEVLAKSGKNDQQVNLFEDQFALLDESGVNRNISSPTQIIRKIELPPVFVPRTYRVDFSDQDLVKTTHEQGILDRNGETTGLPSRLRGTGVGLKDNDSNLKIDRAAGTLEVMTTRNDINRQRNLDNGEYLGIDLGQLGLTGVEDFEIRAKFSKTPLLVGGFGQFGIYVGEQSDRCIRGGLIKWGHEAENNSLFLVNNSDGNDRDSNKVGYFYPGSDIEICFSRKNLKYSLKVINHNDGNSNTLEIRHPDFLDGVGDLQAGIFVANPFSDEHAAVAVDDFSATVWVKKEFER